MLFYINDGAKKVAGRTAGAPMKNPSVPPAVNPLTLTLTLALALTLTLTLTLALALTLTLTLTLTLILTQP